MGELKVMNMVLYILMVLLILVFIKNLMVLLVFLYSFLYLTEVSVTSIGKSMTMDILILKKMLTLTFMDMIFSIVLVLQLMQIVMNLLNTQLMISSTIISIMKVVVLLFFPLQVFSQLLLHY